MRKVNSPKGKYTANIYNGTGGATVDDSVIVEVEEKLTKKKMNIHRDVYDYRHE
ncbi:DUF5412 family protein [Anaerostipes faecalis]|uniref:DUF5412 family protein n=1 Tax=Anaerostipes TaxID=207244 RepID=UPI001C1E25F1